MPQINEATIFHAQKRQEGIQIEQGDDALRCKHWLPKMEWIRSKQKDFEIGNTLRRDLFSIDRPRVYFRIFCTLYPNLPLIPLPLHFKSLQ